MFLTGSAFCAASSALMVRVDNSILLRLPPQVGFECGTWPEPGWLVDQAMVGLALPIFETCSKIIRLYIRSYVKLDSVLS